MFQFIYNVGNIVHDSGIDIVIVALAYAGHRRLRRIERELGITRDGESAIQRVRRKVLREVRSEQ